MSINIKAQSTIEFTFAMIAVMFLVYGMVMTFRWAGMDLAQRRYYQDTSLINITPQYVTTQYTLFGVTYNQVTASYDPIQELAAPDDIVLPLAAVYHGKITNGNTSR